MRPSTLALAAVAVFGCASWALAGPPVAKLPQAALEAHQGIELVRRHHRGGGWGHWRRGRFDRDFAGDNPFAETVGRRSPEAVRPGGSPEAARPDRRRRGGWVDPPRGFQDSR
jgi:hypothetical protein